MEGAVLHDREEAVGVLQQLDVVRRIAVDEHEIGQEAGLDLPQLVPLHHDLAAEPGRRDDCLHRGEAEQGDEMLEVARIAADRVPREAVIAAGQDAHAAPLQLLHDSDRVLELPPHAETFGDAGREAPGSRLVQRRIADADGRHDEDAVLGLVQPVDRLGVGEGRMEDQVDAVAQAHLHRLSRAGMGGDALAALARHLAHRLDLGISHHRLLRPCPRHELVARGVDLQRVDAFADHLPGDLAELFRAVADDGEGLAVEMPQADVAEPARDGHLRRRGEHARAGNFAGVDGIADDHVEPRLGGGGAVDAGETLVEHQLGMARRQQRVLLGRNRAERFEVGRVGEAYVRMGLDEARHQRRAAAVDHHRLAGRRRPLAADALDAVALDEDVTGERFGARAVDDPDVREERACHGDPPGDVCSAA